MKQKNMVLVGVAVVCGLIAAFLTSQMGAKGRAKVEEVPVPVAAKEIPIGTRLPKDPAELAKWVRLVPFPKDRVPQQYVAGMEDMAEKYVMNRTYRENEPFNPMDVSTSGMMAPPEGFGMMSLPIQADAAVSGFIRPGTHVDVWLSVLKRKSNHYVAFPMFLDMLVLAVNQDASGMGAAGGAYQAVSMVSVAVKPEHTELFQLAISRGAQLRLVLRHPEKGKESTYDKIPAPDKIRDILMDKEEEAEPTNKAPEKKPELVKIKVATKEIAAQTELTADLIASAFRDQEVQADKVPANCIRNLAEHLGRFLQKDLAENQFLPLGYLGEKKNEVAPQPMVAQKDPDPMTPKPMDVAGPTKPAPGPTDGATPKAELTLPKVEKKPKPEFTYMSVSGASGVTWYRYLKLPNGESRLVGVVKPGDEEPEEPKESKSDKTKSRED